MTSKPTNPRLYRYDAKRRRWLSTWYDEKGKRRSKAFGYDDTTAKQARARFDFWMLGWGKRPDIFNPEGAEVGYTVTHLAARYLRHASRTYRKDGKPTSHVLAAKYAMRDMHKKLGRRNTSSVEPKDIAELRDAMIWGKDKIGLPKARAMKTVNSRFRIIKDAFAWGAEKGIVPAHVASGVMLVRRLKRDRSSAINPKKINSVSDEMIEQTLPFLPPVVRDMVKFLNVTGVRPEEVCSIRGRELETTGAIWLYRPRHKLEHLEGQAEVVRCLGPQAQAILKPYLRRDLNAFLFSPVEAQSQRLEARKQARKTPRYGKARTYTGAPSQRVGKCYETATLRRAIHFACKQAGIEKWNPNQLRHAVATRLKKKYGSVKGMTYTGHKQLSTFEIYADEDRETAMLIAGEVG